MKRKPRTYRPTVNAPRHTLEVQWLSVGELKTNPRNARTHSARQTRQIADSIKTFGFNNPVLVDENNVVIAGHGRVAAAKSLGFLEVPTIRLKNLRPDQLRAYVLADNRLAELAGWDRSLLAIELQNLSTIDSDFEVTITGFEVPEIDSLLSEPENRTDRDDIFDISDTPQPTTRQGDLWQLGRHRILCANALQPEAYGTLMGRRRAAVGFTDPPYNVQIDGHATGNGKLRHREFQMACGEMDEFQFISFLRTSLRLMARHSSNGSVHFVCMDWRHMAELLEASKQVFDSLQNVCVWVKSNGGMGSLYRSRHELIFAFRNGKNQHQNNIQLGRFGRNRTNVWEYPSINALSKHGEEGNLQTLHPTVKPVALIADALLDCSAREDVVLDGFLGSGSTLIAAERTGRCCYGIEIDASYVDTAIKRWQRYTGDRAIHASTGKPYDEAVAENPERHG